MDELVCEAENSGQEGKISFHENAALYGTTSIILPQLYCVSKVLFNNSVVIN